MKCMYLNSYYKKYKKYKNHILQYKYLNNHYNSCSFLCMMCIHHKKNKFLNKYLSNYYNHYKKNS